MCSLMGILIKRFSFEVSLKLYRLQLTALLDGFNFVYLKMLCLHL